MLPIGDARRPERIPYVTYALIALNLAVHIHQVALTYGDPDRQMAYVGEYGLVPAQLFSADQWAEGGPEAAIPLISFMFVHSGWLHLLSNMLFLWIFGDNVEDRLGRVRYLVFYIVCGLASGIGFALIRTSLDMPLVGASGAIAGLLAAYAWLYPNRPIRTLVVLVIIVTIIELPAYLVIGIWFALQVLRGLGAEAELGGVAWWAHVFGFVVGYLIVRAWYPHRDRRLRGSGPSAGASSYRLRLD